MYSFRKVPAKRGIYFMDHESHAMLWSG